MTNLFVFEAAAPAYKRNGSSITRYYRCTSGPKKGKLASEPAKCGMRPNPKKVRHGRKVAKQKGAIRVRKTAIAKLQQISKKITDLNRNLNNRNSPTSNLKETFLKHIAISQGSLVYLNEYYSDDIMDIFEYDYAQLDAAINFIIEFKLDNANRLDIIVEQDDIVLYVESNSETIGYILNE